MGFQFTRPALVAALLLTGGTSVLAAQLNFGVTGGVNFATLHGDDIDFNSTTGWSAGLYGGIGFGPNLSVEGQALYSRKGAESDIGDLTQDYFQVPLLLKYHFGSPESTRLYLFAGPAFNWQWSCEIDSGDTSVDCEDLAANPEDATFSGMFGAGVQFGRLGLEARYETGFSDTIENIESKDGTFSILARLAILGSR